MSGANLHQLLEYIFVYVEYDVYEPKHTQAILRSVRVYVCVCERELAESFARFCEIAIRAVLMI